MIVENIHTVLGKEELNPMTIVWDMEITPPENEGDDEQRDVTKIHSVKIKVFDAVAVEADDIFIGPGSSEHLRHRLKEELLEAVEYETIEELKSELV